jgi:hypothetical protein
VGRPAERSLRGRRTLSRNVKIVGRGTPASSRVPILCRREIGRGAGRSRCACARRGGGAADDGGSHSYRLVGGGLTSANRNRCRPFRLRTAESGGGRERSMGNRAAPSALAQGSQNPEKLQPGFGHRKGIGALREKGRVVVGVVHRGERRESVAAEFGPQTRPECSYNPIPAAFAGSLSSVYASFTEAAAGPLARLHTAPGARESPAVRRNASARRPHLPLGRPRRSRGRGRRIRGPARRAGLPRARDGRLRSVNTCRTSVFACGCRSPHYCGK